LKIIKTHNETIRNKKKM